MMGCELPPTSFLEAYAILLNGVVQVYSGGKFSIVFDATDSARVAQKTQIDQKGAYEIFGLPISFRILASQPKAQTSNRKPSRYCTFYRPPKFVTSAAGFGGIGHYAVIFEHGSYVLQVFSQLVVRKLIGFCGNQ